MGVDPEKIRAIKEWPAQINARELKIFRPHGILLTVCAELWKRGHLTYTIVEGWSV